jgi:hypothetical protein
MTTNPSSPARRGVSAASGPARALSLVPCLSPRPVKHTQIYSSEQRRSRKATRQTDAICPLSMRAPDAQLADLRDAPHRRERGGWPAWPPAPFLDVAAGIPGTCRVRCLDSANKASAQEHIGMDGLCLT